MQTSAEEVLCPRTNYDHRQLLYELKKSVDLWFLSRRDYLDERVDGRDSCWQVLSAVRMVLLDGFLGQVTNEKTIDCSALLRDLNWLKPPLFGDEKPIKFPHLKPKDPLSLWIYTNFKKSTLCGRLQILVADLELLTHYYSPIAFLCNDRYATALFICLSAIELNQSSLISQIDATLYVQNMAIPKHKRSSSHPHFSISPKKYAETFVTAKQLTRSSTTDVTDTNEPHPQISQSLNESYPSSNAINQENSLLLRRCKSLPNIKETQPFKRSRSKTFTQPISIPTEMYPTKRISVYDNDSYSSGCNNTASTSKSSEASDLIPINLVKCDDIKIYFDQHQASTSRSETTIDYDSPPKSLRPINFLSCISTNLFTSPNGSLKEPITSGNSSYSTSAPHDFVSAFLPQEGKKMSRHTYTMFDEIEGDATHDCESRIPADGQSLVSFLQSVQFSRNNTDLERENAHFRISEAMISMIENMICTRVERKRQKAERRKANEKKDLQIKKRRMRSGQNDASSRVSNSSLSDIETGQEEFEHLSNSSSDESCENILRKFTKPSQSTNDHIAFAEWENNLEALSAEGVALSLISKFSDNQLPRASDIAWLVSEKDAPQQLLPMPGTPAADPDENYAHPFLRGTRDWAPPRQQIIFTNHSPPNRKQLMQQQNYRCTGCGMRVSRIYMHRFRYCTYLGKYHCTGCHRNQMSTIPAKVLEKWDFSYYPVSVFAYRLLDQIWMYPLFYVPDLNPQLYIKIKNLNMCKLRRIQLKYIQDFIVTCRFAMEEKKLFDNLPSHITLEPDKWSMFDFVSAKDGSLQKSLLALIGQCEDHVLKCELCTARGFICELCPKKQIIFPWQLRIKRCEKCGTCYHQKCWENALECTKCQRLRKREQKTVFN